MRIEERFQTGQSLKKLSTFGIGGFARYYLKAAQVEDIEQAIQWAIQNRIPYFILGNGSNCLFDDRGYNGLLIHNKIDFCEYRETSILAGAGVRFSWLGVKTAQMGLSGLEFASGIPATVGGAVFMNAGANGRDTSLAVDEVVFLHESGEKKTYRRNELEFDYRFSSFHSMRGSILAAAFVLEKNPDARKIQCDIAKYRKLSQPLSEKSAGCVFRNPSANHSAGALIDRCGLKGFSIGGAKVSEMHANFIINVANASREDVISLVHHIQETVNQKTGIQLKMEIRLVPFE